MSKAQEMVREFHQTFGLTINDTPTVPSLADRALRYTLIEEELNELALAFERGSLTAIADAIGDLLYVTYGTAVCCGIDMKPIFVEIHRSNMTKVGGTKRADGKLVKPETYSPANLKPILEAQKGVSVCTID